MKKRLLAIMLAIAVVAVALAPAAALGASQISGVSFFVEKNADAGLNGEVSIEFSGSNKSYTGKLYLPGSADPDSLALSWTPTEDVVVQLEGETLASGSAPIPAAGQNLTYTVTANSSTSTFKVTTVQGSESVEGLFLTVDEDYVDDEGTHTISDMLGDTLHETSCYGALSLDGDDYDMSIKGHGNYTWTHGKKHPYNLTIYKDENANKGIAKYGKKDKVELIDGVKSKKWALLANYPDGSMMNNKIGYNLAEKMGIGLESRYVDLWMNGEYLGTYLMTPKTDYQAPDAGYFLELDNTYDNEDPYFELDGLEVAGTAKNVITVKSIGDDAVDAGVTVADIQEWMQDMLDAVRDTKSSRYTEYIDVDSWAKLYLIEEYVKNYDIVCGSIFMHRDGLSASDKLIAGPLWDLDNAWARTTTNPNLGISDSKQHSADGWYIDSVSGFTDFLQYLGMHADFMQRVYEIYNEYRDEFGYVLTDIDNVAAELKASADMNYALWDVNQTDYTITRRTSDTTVGSGTYAYKQYKTDSWEDFVANLRSFAAARLSFFEASLGVDAPSVSTISGSTEVEVLHTLALSVENTAAGYQWQLSSDGKTWTNISGATSRALSITAKSPMNGQQVRCVAKNFGSVIQTSTVGKASAAATAASEPVLLTVNQGSHEHSFGGWVAVGDGTHAHTCSTCEAVETESCSSFYGTDHRCTKCGSLDPSVELVTVTFVTGEGASAAPEAQTLVSGEETATKPADPTRVGYRFGGWFAEGSLVTFDFDALVTADVTLTAKWTVCTHEYQNGTCIHCGASAAVTHLDLTDSASASYLDIVNQKSTSIQQGKGLYMVSTKDAFENCKNQLSGSSATTPLDAVIIKAEGDWTATVAFELNRNSSQGYYEFFGFYAMDDYDNLVGLRAGDGSIQDFLRVDGTISGDTTGVKTSTGLKSATNHWLRIAKTGDDYTCYWSTDGNTFTKVCTFEDTGITGNKIILDAYSGMATGYEYLVKSVDFSVGGASLPDPPQASLDSINFVVKANAGAGLDGDVAIDLTKKSGSYSGILYLPGDADVSQLALSWNFEDQVTLVPEGGSAVTSGNAPIAAAGNTAKYTVKVGDQEASLSVATMQGSKGIGGMFFTIDESKGSIAAMNDDDDHETPCYGSVAVDGSGYYVEMKGRGNSSWTYDFDRKPYNFTLYKDSEYTDKKSAELIDGVSKKKWSLLANAKDNTLLRNRIALELGNELGVGIENRYVDVWVNGSYWGNYLMTPKSDYQAPDNGYFLELDNKVDNQDPQISIDGISNSDHRAVFTVKDNGAGASTDEIKAYLKEAVNAVLDTKTSNYLNYFDLDSWAKVYILNEFYKDIDVVSGSKFMYRETLDASSKLIAGPIWDFDGSLGRTHYNQWSGLPNNDQMTADGWYIDAVTSTGATGGSQQKAYSLLQLLAKHDDFLERVYQLYNEYKASFDNVNAFVDEQAAFIADSAAMNYSKFEENQTVEDLFGVSSAKTIGSGTYALNYVKTTEWSHYVTNLKTFVKQRLAFLSDNLTVAAPEGSLVSEESAGATTLKAVLTANGTGATYRWQSSADGKTWTDITGAATATYTIPAAGANLTYRCVVTNYGSVIDASKVADVKTSAATVLTLEEPVVVEEGYEATFACGDHVSVTVYPTQDLAGEGTPNATSALSRDGTTGVADKSGSGQVNFTIQVDEGWKVDQVTVTPDGSFKNLKLPADTGNGSYRITKISGPITVTVTAVEDKCDHSFVEGECEHCGAKALKASFACEGGCSVTVFDTQDTTVAGTTNAELAYARNSATGDIDISGEGQVNFQVVLAEGAKLLSVTAEGKYKNLKVVDADAHIYRVTKIEGDVTITVSACSHEYGSWQTVTPATCTQKGLEQRTCANEACGHVESRDIDPLGHSFGDWDVVTPATCTQKGLEQRTCNHDGCTEVESRDIDSLGHSFGDWQTVTPAGCTTSGLEQRSCSNNGCTEVESREIEAHGHEYEGGVCKHCQEPYPQCQGEKAVSLTAGTLTMSLGGQLAGEFTFAQSGDGWTILGSDGKYLGFANKAFTYSTNAFVWNYSNGRFSTSVTSSSRSNWSWLWSGGSSTSTTYYLIRSGSGFAVSTSTSAASATFTMSAANGEHTYGAWVQSDNETHTRTCEICGHVDTGNCSDCYGADHYCTECGRFDPSAATVDVNVAVTSKTTGSSWFWFWGGSRKTTYTATITATPTGTTVTRVEYSTDNATWTTGTSYSSSQNITQLYVNVVTPAGTFNYVYNQGSGTTPIA